MAELRKMRYWIYLVNGYPSAKLGDPRYISGAKRTRYIHLPGIFSLRIEFYSILRIDPDPSFRKED